MANKNKLIILLLTLTFSSAALVSAQSPVASPAAGEADKVSAQSPATSPAADEADSSTADKSSNSALSPFAAVPPTGDLLSDIAPSADDPTDDNNSDAAPVGGPNADYPPSEGEHYKDDIGSGSVKVATVTVSSISFLAAGYLFF